MRDPHCIQCGQLITHFGKGYKHSLHKINGRYCHESCYSIYMSPENKRKRANLWVKRWRHAHGVKPRPPRLSYEERSKRRHNHYLKIRDKKLTQDKIRWDNMTPEHRHKRLERMNKTNCMIDQR